MTTATERLLDGMLHQKRCIGKGARRMRLFWQRGELERAVNMATLVNLRHQYIELLWTWYGIRGGLN